MVMVFPRNLSEKSFKESNYYLSRIRLKNERVLNVVDLMRTNTAIAAVVQFERRNLDKCFVQYISIH